MFDDPATKRICSTCVAEAGKRKATPASGGKPGREPNKTKGGSEKGSGSRARPDNNAKVEILKLVDAKVSYAQIANRFGCSVRFLKGEGYIYLVCFSFCGALPVVLVLV